MTTMELKNYGSSVRGIRTNDGGKVVVNINFENISNPQIGDLEEMAYEFLERVSKIIEKES